MLASLVAVALLPALLPTVHADATMIGCSAFPTFPRGLTGLKVLITKWSTALNTCTTNGYHYVSGQGPDSTAAGYFGWCSNYTAIDDPVKSGPWVQGTSSTTCGYATYAINVPYTFSQCYSADMHYYPGASNGNMFDPASNSAYYTLEQSVRDPYTCLTTCGANFGRYAVWSTNAEHPCVCAANFAGTPATCTDGTYNVFAFTGVIPSGLPGYQKRQVAERAERETRGRAECFRGFDVCAVGGVGASEWECLDTEVELESCGGCVYGGFNSTGAATPTGVDCTALPGVDPRRVTCSRGQCVVSACRRGYALGNGVCEPVKAHRG